VGALNILFKKRGVGKIYKLFSHYRIEKKMVKKNKNLKKIITAVAIIIIIVTILLIFKMRMTGHATGITLGTPKNYGLTSSQPITIGVDVTKKLCAASYTTDIAATATDIANRANGGVEGAIKDALGVPSTELPDIYGVMAIVANYFKESKVTECLRKIGVASCKTGCTSCTDWKGTLYVNFDMSRQKSSLYPDWEYYNEKIRYVGQGIDCTAQLGCAFSYNPKTTDISKSCLG
jgi:hypothetical protein